MVGAGCLESTRLLLNSGIANSSGVLGHYLFDQFYVKGTVQAIVPEARDGKGGADLMGGAGYIPRFRNIDSKGAGFHSRVFGGFRQRRNPRREIFPALRRGVAESGGVAPRHRLRCDDDGLSTAALRELREHRSVNRGCMGVPALHIQAKYTDNEFNMAREQ